MKDEHYMATEEERKRIIAQNEILDRLQNICSERDKKFKEFQKTYNEEIVQPALENLRKECGDIGHKYTRSFELFGYTYYVCYYCGYQNKKEKGELP